jgi:hypothetical protein
MSWSMTITSRPSALFRGSAFLEAPRAYRLVDAQGSPHPVLDDHYDSHEAAWAEALSWWEMQDRSSHEPINIGVEVSTSNGDWRTIRHPGS